MQRHVRLLAHDPDIERLRRKVEKRARYELPNTTVIECRCGTALQEEPIIFYSTPVGTDAGADID